MIPKFRAWLKEEQRMVDVREMTFMYDEVYLISDVTGFYAYEEFKLMQFTGLKDKNGKEIFDGDVVRFTLTDGFSYVTLEDGVVTYELGAFYVVDGLAKYLISDVNTNGIEVIGNAFEIDAI